MLQKNVIKHPKGKIEIQIVVPWIELEQNWNEIAYNASEHNLIIKLKEEFLQKIMPKFLKNISVETVEDLQIKTKKYLEEYQLYNNELSFEEKILSEIEKITTVELPDILIEDELNRMLVNLQRKVADMGLVLDNYLKNQ